MWRQYVSPKRHCVPKTPHSVKIQKTNIDIDLNRIGTQVTSSCKILEIPIVAQMVKKSFVF
jgi:hypothetical protein